MSDLVGSRGQQQWPSTGVLVPGLGVAFALGESGQ